MRKRILIIDDDPDLTALVRIMLEQKGYAVAEAHSGKMGISVIRRHPPDLILLDIMMPEVDGWQVLEFVRKEGNIPLVLLSAVSQTEAVVSGLQDGADDYIRKPFSKDELTARIEAILRRSASTRAKETITPEISVDLKRGAVYINDRPIGFTRTEIKLILFLYRHRGRTLLFDEILEHVWGRAYRGNEHYVHGYVYRIRRKLDRLGVHTPLITSERGAGYRFSQELI